MSRKTITVKARLKDGSVKTYRYERKVKPTVPGFGTLGHIIVSYQTTAAWRALGAGTQTAYERAFKYIPVELLNSPIENIKRRNILMLRELVAIRGEGQANMVLAVISQLFKHAIDLDLIENNPCRDVPRFKQNQGAPWTEEQVTYWLENAREEMRRAVLLALATGQRRSDLVRLTWGQWDGDWITLTQQKTGTELSIPLDKEMQRELARWKRETQTTTILATYRGKPWTPEAFSIAFDREVRRLGMVGLSIHGCRHLAATRLALAGASAFEVAAITGHKSLGNVQRYTRTADQKRRASNALGKLVSFVQTKGTNGAK